MKDPVRMLDGDASDVERALLLAGAAEEPPPDGARRLAATLGVSTALLGAAKAAASSAAASGATASAGTGAAASASTPPGAAAAVSPFAAGLALKWLALAGGGAAIAAAVLVMRSSDAPRLPEEDAAGRAPHGLREPAPAEPRALDPAQPAKAAVPADRAAREATPRPRPDADRGRPKSIAREIEQLDAARDLLQRGQARAALSVLDAYRRDHERGVLDQEAALLRIEALSRAGERAAARRNAERFLRDNPKSPHEDRVRALVGSGSDGR